MTDVQNIPQATQTHDAGDDIMALCVGLASEDDSSRDLCVVWTECAMPDQHDFAVSILTALKDPLEEMEYECYQGCSAEGFVTDSEGDNTISHIENDPAKPCILFHANKTPIDLEKFFDDVMAEAARSEYMEPVLRQ